MAVQLFASIDVGSYELNMKIIEFNNNSMKVVDNLKYRLDLGSYTYSGGKLPIEKLDELCHVLNRFKKIMESYGVSDYKAYATSAIRETVNREFVIDQIEQRTEIKVSILSNSEQRFLDYKSIASKGDAFKKTIEKGTAILDIGGGSIQLSLFDNDRLYVTQNIGVGVLRIKEELTNMSIKPSRHEELIDELIGSRMMSFKRLFLGNKASIPNLIIVDDYVSPIVAARADNESMPGTVSTERYEGFLDRLKVMNPVEFARKYSVALENVPLVFIAAIIIRNVIEMTGAVSLWCPGVSLVDGIAYEYGEKKKLISSLHDFEEDIVACSKNISKRYLCDEKRGQVLEKLCISFFDSIRDVHGMGERDRLLLRLAAILNDCGKFISFNNQASCSVDIIMSTEIIGLSHEERAIVANVVKYNNEIFDYNLIRTGNEDMGREGFIRVAKLTAILRLAGCLEFGQNYKFKDVRASLEEDGLIINVKTNRSISLEKEMFKSRKRFFEEIFSIKPVLNRVM